MTPSPAEPVRRFWEDAWTAGDLGALDEVLAPGFLENGEQVRPRDFADGLARWRQVFPDFTATVEELLVLGPDRAVSRVTYRGTQRGWLWGLPPAGRTFTGMGIDLFTVVDGRITTLWHSADHLDLALQIGARLVPDESSPA